jgi:hypothetical protein
MRRIRRLILRGGLLISLVITIVLIVQAIGMTPPFGWSWGDGARGRAYSIEFDDGTIILRTASGMMKTAPPGPFTYATKMLGAFDGVGFEYHRWQMIPMTPSNQPIPGFSFGSFIQANISGGWALFVSLVLLSLCVLDVVMQRRRRRAAHLCQNCGYDLRATPDRCPECGVATASSIPSNPTLDAP